MNSTVLELNPRSVWLEIFPELQNEAWQQSASFTSETNRQRAYINLLSHKIILPYLQAEITCATIQANQDSIWELGVNGSVIKIDNQRLIIIPSEALDIDELRIPQEWVDIPQLAADYYLAVQVDTEKNFLRIWGYTTHKKLKEQGHYTKRDRSYSLDRDNIIEDVDSLWLIRQYYGNEPTRSEIQPLATLSNDELIQLLNTLGDPELIFPRRTVAFDQWGAIFANENWRQMLVERRQPQALNSEVNLSEWFKNIFSEGWQTIDQVLAPSQLAFFQAGNEIKRIKDLGLELNGHKLALMILVRPIESGVTVRASVYATGEKNTLPLNLKLMILDDTGEVFKEVTSLSDDEFIRYEFDVETGDRFAIKIALDSTSITEYFQV